MNGQNKELSLVVVVVAVVFVHFEQVEWRDFGGETVFEEMRRMETK